LFIVPLIALLFSWAPDISARTLSDSVESGSWRFEFDNDLFVGDDAQLSGGWALQKHSPVAQSWQTLDGVPEFVRRWGSAIPTLTEEGLVYRAGIAVGQIVQTPSDLSRSDLIEDDVPYAGALTVQASWYGYNDDELRGFEITVGVVGPPSLAEEVQKTAHDLTGSQRPQGWENQLGTEPVLNLNYMRKRKILHWGDPAGVSFDAALNGNLGLGNLFTQATGGIEMRFGRNLPGGFAYVPDPIGYSVHYLAALRPPNPAKASFYGTLVLRASAFAHNILLDGNSFRDSHSVRKEPLVGQAIAGLHYERSDWAARLHLMVSTDTVDTHDAPAAAGDERLGSLSVEWRF